LKYLICLNILILINLIILNFLLYKNLFYLILRININSIIWTAHKSTHLYLLSILILSISHMNLFIIINLILNKKRWFSLLKKAIIVRFSWIELIIILYIIDLINFILIINNTKLGINAFVQICFNITLGIIIIAFSKINKWRACQMPFIFFIG